MNKRSSYAKFIPKLKFTPQILNKECETMRCNPQKTLKFQFPTDDNCYTLFNLQTQKLNGKTRIKIPPIVHQLQQGTLQHFRLQEKDLFKKQKTYECTKTQGNATDRPNFHVRKITTSLKSTTNGSETKTLSGQEKHSNQDEWETSYHNQNYQKPGNSNITQATAERFTQKHRSTQRCLIAKTNRLPFSLDKKKSKANIFSYNKKAQERAQGSEPFLLNISSILNQKQPQFFSAESIQDLNIFC